MSSEWLPVKFSNCTAQAKFASVMPVLIRSFGQEETQQHICFKMQLQDGTSKMLRLVVPDKTLNEWNEQAGFNLIDDLNLMVRLLQLRCATTVPMSELPIYKKDLEGLLSPAVRKL